MIVKKLLVIFSVLTLVSCIGDKGETPVVVNHVEVGDPLPQFSIRNAEGEVLTNEDFIGKKSLLVFFHTSCGDCKRELPKVNDTWLELGDDPDFQIVTIARRQTVAEIEKYWTNPENYSQTFTMPYYSDPMAETYLKFAENYVPRLYIINTKGIITWMAVEKTDLTSEQIVAKLRSQD